jgi:glycerol-1-phosphate dehydrogenase [NAD(P)+]
MTATDLESLKQRILDHWDEIQDIARSVPSPEQVEAWLAAVKAPIRPAEIGLSQAEIILGLQSAHYLRDRFTLNRLGYWLNLPLPD